jgi:cell division septum initiation protein DivIVA
MEEFVEKCEREDLAVLEKNMESLSAEQRDEYLQWHYPTHWQEIFSNRLRASFIMQLCSFVESELSEICRRVEIIARAPLSVSDLRGSTLSKPKKYLQAFARLERPTEELWRTLERIFDVRNVMLHEAGFAGRYRNQKDIADFSAVASGLRLNHDHIEIKREFCLYCLSTVTEFSDDLHDAYESFRVANQALARLEAPEGI